MSGSVFNAVKYIQTVTDKLRTPRANTKHAAKSGHWSRIVVTIKRENGCLVFAHLLGVTRNEYGHPYPQANAQTARYAYSTDKKNSTLLSICAYQTRFPAAAPIGYYSRHLPCSFRFQRRFGALPCVLWHQARRATQVQRAVCVVHAISADVFTKAACVHTLVILGTPMSVLILGPRSVSFGP